MALLAAGMMAACSSTRTGSGSSSGTTGMDMGSSTDVGTASMDNSETTSGTMETTGGVITNGTVGSDNTLASSGIMNTDDSTSGTYPNGDANGSTYDTGISGSMSSSSNGSSYGSGTNSGSNNMNGTGSTSGWSGSGNNNVYGSSQMSFFMNGYQGPLNYSNFSTYNSAQSFLPMAAESGMREVELSRIAQQKSSNPDVRAFAEMMVRDHSTNNQQLMNVASTKNINIQAPAFSNSANMSGSYGASASTGTSTNGSGMNGSMGAGGSVNSGSGYSDNNDSGSMNKDGSMNMNGSSSMNSSAMTTMNEITSLNNLSGQQFDQQYMRMMLQDHYQAIALFQSAAQSDDPQVKSYAQKTLPALQAHLAHAKMVNRKLF
ncbi:MAG: hypothetical protein K0S09_334 [Sphingobacteriaceae bacterium]|nr:hypothetical protein [Sphingobacteriaceae bacterium]